MRHDFAFGLSVSIGGVAAGVALMVAPSYLHLSQWGETLCFWGGIGIAVICFAIAVRLGAFVTDTRGIEPSQSWTSQAEGTDTPPIAGIAEIDLKKLSNAQLLAKTIQIANEMRVFEANFIAADRVQSHEQWAIRSAQLTTLTQEQKNAAWLADGLKDAQRRAPFQAEFMSRYYPLAMALRHELSRRLGIFPPYKKGPDIQSVLDYGNFSGPSPITQAADYVEALARRLP